VEKGDLDTSSAERRIVVLEGVLCTPVPIPRKLFRAAGWTPAVEWGWMAGPLRSMQDWRYRLSITVEVVTFLGTEVAYAAAEWLNEYDSGVDGVSAVDYHTFCRSLTWRPEIDMVIDSSEERAENYGQKGYLTVFGGVF
jgi:hypothetical protein